MSERKLTPLEEANLGLRGRKAVEGAKALLKENTTIVIRPQSLTPEEAYAKRIEAEQFEEVMELLVTEAREALAINPNDTDAQCRILEYQQWRRNKNKPGLVITKGQRCRGQRNVGVWQRTRDFGWLIKVSGGSAVGDTVDVRRKGGQTIPMKLTVEVAPGYFRAREV
jgi:hypothetical protein